MKKNLALLLILSLSLHQLSAQDLHEAVENKDHAKVESLLKSGAKPNKTNKKNQFPLWLAVWNEDVEMVKLLVANWADAKQKFKGKDGISNCIEIASQNGLLEITKILVDNGADPNEKIFRGCTPLRTASRNGRIEVVQYLVSKGVDIDSQADDKATPLEAAAGKGHMEIVQILVEKGANVNHQDKEGDSPLNEAARGGHEAVVKYLLSKGADVSLKNNEGQTAEIIAKLAGQTKVEALLKEHKK